MNKVLYIVISALILPFCGISQNFGFDSISNWTRKDLPEIDKEVFNDVWGWHDGNGNEYAIMGSLDSIYFIDITDAKKPVLRDVKAGRANYSIHRDFKTLDQYCYAVGDEGEASLQIFDLSYLPDSVHKVYDSDSLCKRAHNIFIDNEKLYLGTCRTRFGRIIPMRVLSIKNRTSPEFLADVYGPKIGGNPIFQEVHDMFAKNDTVYCSAGDDGLYALEYKKDSTLKTKGDSSWYKVNHSYEMVQWGSIVVYPSQGYNHSSWLSNNSKIMVMADETHGAKLKMIEFTWDDVPTVLSTFGSASNEGSLPHNPFIYKKKVYISYYHEGVLVYDINDPENPKKIAHWDTYPDNVDYTGMYGCWGVYPFLPSGNIIASDQIYGLFVFNLKTDVAEISKNQSFEVFPNPLKNGQVHIQFISGVETEKIIEAFDINGRSVYSQKTSAANCVIHKNDLGNAGLYILKVRSNGQLASQLLMVE